MLVIKQLFHTSLCHCLSVLKAKTYDFIYLTLEWKDRNLSLISECAGKSTFNYRWLQGTIMAVFTSFPFSFCFSFSNLKLEEKIHVLISWHVKYTMLQSFSITVSNLLSCCSEDAINVSLISRASLPHDIERDAQKNTWSV